MLFRNPDFWTIEQNTVIWMIFGARLSPWMV
jgi:hypothetical protein